MAARIHRRRARRGHSRDRQQPRGFTLLEVMVSVAILGLGLTAILSAQANAFRAAAHARDVSEATGLLRCKMLEVEEDIARDGFQELDVNQNGPCCEGINNARMTCTWAIEKPEFPEPAFGQLDLDSGLEDQTLGPLGGLATESSSSVSDVGDAASMLSSLGGGDEGGDGEGDDGGLGGIFGSMMSMVYPQLKPIFESSARRITVTIRWRRGNQERTIDLVQWVTRPQLPVNADQADALSDAIDGATGGGDVDSGSKPAAPRPNMGGR